MDPKPRPNHRVYIEGLRRMTPAQRLAAAFDLSESARDLFATGLRRAFPDLDDSAFRRLLHARLDRCHNRNY